MVTTPASKGLPIVIVSLQQTQLDDQATLRIFATTDVFADILCEVMGIERPQRSGGGGGEEKNENQEEKKEKVREKETLEAAPSPCSRYTFYGENEEETYRVPYDPSDGTWSSEQHDSDDSSTLTTLSLFDGARVRLTVGPHCGDVGEVVGRDKQGHYIIIFQHRLKTTSKLTRPFERRMGAWWVKHAIEGTIVRLPIVNVAGK
jgi:hypothetical protein